MAKLEGPQKRKIQDWRLEGPRRAPLQPAGMETGMSGRPSAGKANEANRKEGVGKGHPEC